MNYNSTNFSYSNSSILFIASSNLLLKLSLSVCSIVVDLVLTISPLSCTEFGLIFPELHFKVLGTRFCLWRPSGVVPRHRVPFLLSYSFSRYSYHRQRYCAFGGHDNVWHRLVPVLSDSRSSSGMRLQYESWRETKRRRRCLYFSV